MSIKQMHEAIGRAVLWSQAFETVFLICFRLIGMMQTEALTSINPKEFKTPIRNLIKQLKSANNVAPEFESQVNELIEKRHKLVHRWYQEKGIPSIEDVQGIAELTRLALDVESESKRISSLLAGYVSKWGKGNPTSFTIDDRERSRLMLLFQKAHLGPPSATAKSGIADDSLGPAPRCR